MMFQEYKISNRTFKTLSFIAMIALLFPSKSFSQQKYIDSLLLVENNLKIKGDSSHIKLLCRLSTAYESINLDSSLVFGERAFSYATKINYQKGIASSLTCIGYYYNAKGNYELSLENFIEANKIYETLGDHLATCESYNSIGNCYIGYGKVDKALESYLEGYHLALKHNFSNKQGVLAIGVGNSYVELGEHQKALDYFLVSKEIFTSIQSDYLISYSLICIANAQSGLEQYIAAFKNYESAIEILEKTDNLYGKAAAYQEIAATYQKVKNYDKAIEYFKKAKVIFEERKAFDNLKNISLSLSKAYASKSNFEQAYLNHIAFSSYNDSIMSEKVSNQILEIEGKYEAEKKQKEIEFKNLLLSEKDAKLAEESLRSSILFLIVGIVILFAMIVIIGYMIKRKNNKLLNTINQNLEIKNQIIEEKTKEIVDSINYAKNIQNAIIPPIETVRKYLPNSFVLYIPKDIVAGDFYWIQKYNIQNSDKEMLYFAVADCTGHGVPGALVSVVCNNALVRSIKEYHHTEPAEILNKTRELVVETFNNSTENIKDGMDISLAAIVRNESPENGNEIAHSILWSGANNPLWIIRKDTNVIEEIKADKQPIGLSHKYTPFTQHELNLQKGDALYLFTDGYADQFGGTEKVGGKKFMYKRLKELILSIKEYPIEQQEQILMNKFNAWKGEFEQLDDVCIMGVRI
jgi:serine phosphatase RsbU (regulator of sigma subunit)